MHVWIFTFCFLQMTADAQVTISADKILPRDGETVILTCSIPSFKVPATWINNSTGQTLAYCPPPGPCEPTNNLARYTYSATASSVGVIITSFNSMQDTFGWKCQYGTESALYDIKPVVPVTTVPLTNTSGETLSSTINVVRGGIAYIRCSTAPRGSRPPATFHWYSRTVNQSPVLIGNQSISSTPGSVMVPGQPESDLVISYSTLTQTGDPLYHNKYIFCEARDEMSTGNYTQSEEVQINIVYSPLVQLSPNYSVYNVTEGTQKFVFTCNIVEANPLPQSNGYSWLHNSLVIQGQVSSSYTIPSVQKSDDGEYKCTARNDYGSGTSDALTLNVQYPPLIQGLTNPYKVIEYQPLNVTCKVSSNPPPYRIFWSPTGESSVQSMLYFSSISRDNSGAYSCTAQNTMTPTNGGQQRGTNTSQLEVDVLYPPLIKGLTSPYKVIENHPLNVTCKVTSNPQPDQISWYPSGESSVPSTLYIRSVSRSNSGIYICTAQNTMKPTGGGQQTGMTTSQIQIDVLYTAKITEFFTKGNITEIMENSTFQLYCDVDSNPYSEISLIFGGVLKSMSRDSSELMYNATAGCLNAGKYICSATNSIMNGVTVSAEINLKIQCHPRLDFRKNISVEYYRALNDNITLEVSIIAYPEPTNIMWYHRVAETDIWERVLNRFFSSTGLHSNIFLHLGSQRDFGDYLVNMSNSFGIYELIFHVVPESVPGIPTDFSITDRSFDSITLEWTPGVWGGHTQSFAIEYRIYPHGTWIDTGSIQEDTNTEKQSFTVNGLQQKTTYEFRMYARNKIGQSNTTQVINTTTSEVMQVPPEVQVGAIVGGVVGSGVIVGVIGIILVIIFKSRQKLVKKEGLVDNSMYETPGERFGLSASKGITVADTTVVKLKEKAALVEDPGQLYAKVDKTNTNGKKGDIYQNVDVEVKSRNADSKYENSRKRTCDENVFENPGTITYNNPQVNNDGLLYADLMLGPPTTKNGKVMIQVIENRTEYAQIAYGKRGEPLPDSDVGKNDAGGKKKKIDE